jgi:hypothetical protein
MGGVPLASNSLIYLKTKINKNRKVESNLRFAVEEVRKEAKKKGLIFLIFFPFSTSSTLRLKFFFLGKKGKKGDGKKVTVTKK